MNTANLIRSARLERNLSQKEVSMALGFKSPMFVSILECGKASLPHTHIKPIAKILGISKQSLIDTLILDISNKLREESK